MHTKYRSCVRYLKLLFLKDHLQKFFFSFHKNCKNTSQNIKSRIPIRDIKFLTYSYTHTSSFIFEKKSHFENPLFMKCCKILNFENFDDFGKCEIQINPWGALKWGKNLKNSGKTHCLFRKSLFLPHFSRFCTLTFPKKSTPGPPGVTFFQKCPKFPKMSIFLKSPKKSRKIRQKMSNHV